jgi:hypothetical protein
MTKEKITGIRLSSAAVDLAKERAGDWVPYEPWPGVEFKVRSTESPQFKEARDAMQRAQQMRTGVKPSQDDWSRELGLLYAEHLLLDWKGLFEDDGNTPIPYSPQLAAATLSNPAYRNVAMAVLTCAMRVGAAEIDFVTVSAGN